MQAEEITLTIGQAFDLAYRRFIETSGKDLETQRHLVLLQQKLKTLENENAVLRQRLSDVSKIKGTVRKFVIYNLILTKKWKFLRNNEIFIRSGGCRGIHG